MTMRSPARLILLLCLVATLARAEWWDDFSNNLASDLAPILALFGEQVTKQFLSESTTRLDTFIFAMVPLGILTAVVSAVRVCGGPSLRAFVGRAQEGAGVAEAELCSSTSRDVCELYHSGAVVRVFGRPKIAEIVHDPRGASFYETERRPAEDEHPVAGKAGLYSFRDYIGGPMARDSGWSENDRPVGESRKDRSLVRMCKWLLSKLHIRYPDDGDYNGAMNFAPNPNLSLNYGIKKHSLIVYWGAAVVGFVLQASVLWFGALTTYRWRWKKNDAYAPDWAFPMMVFGTVLQCAGMFWCAYLIEASTKERVFRRHQETDQPSSSAIFVVQPGNQVIGDQTFDSFSYNDSGNRMKEYTTSWKDPLQQAAPGKAAASVAVTMVGFILQFVSLRAMHSAVSVFQLGAILAMSFLRSMLRTRRLAREQNLLFNCPDMVQGYELDWLALRINETQVPILKPTKSFPSDTDSRASPSLAPQNPNSHSVLQIDSVNGDGTLRACGFTYVGEDHLSPGIGNAMKARHAKWLQDTECPKDSATPHCGARQFYYRARLAQLTSESPVSSQLSTAWGEDVVRTRSQARLLKNAIETSAAIIFSRANIKPDWKTAQIFTWPFSTRPWSSGSVEALYGSQIHLTVKRSWLVGNETFIQRSWDAGSQQSTWHVEQDVMEAVIGLYAWSLQSDPVTKENDGFGNTVSRAAAVGTERILGVSNELKNLKPIKKEMTFWIEEFPALTREVFAKPRGVGDGVREVDKVSYNLWERDGNCFEDSGLGSRQDGYLIIVSALRSRGILNLPRDSLSDVISTAETHRRAGGYEKAEELLQWAWSASDHMQSDTSEKPVPAERDASADTPGDNFRRPARAERDAIMLELGELYRLAKEPEFRHNGVSWMNSTKTDRDPCISTAACEIVDRYVALASKKACDTAPSSEAITKAISDGDRLQTLLFLSQKGIQLLSSDSDRRTVLSWAAQQGWPEVVKAALEIGSNVDAGDKMGRTALSYATKHGHIEIMAILLKHQASPILEDNSGRSPVSYAAATGSVAALETLMSDGRVTVETKDANGRSPLHFAAVEGATDAVKLLLKSAGRMVDAATKKGITPLLAALMHEHHDTAQVLVDNGAKWDTPIEKSGGELVSSWIWAADTGHWICAEYLLAQLNSREAMDSSAAEVLKTAMSIELWPPNLGGMSPSEFEEALHRRSKSLVERGGLILRQFGAKGEEVVVKSESVELLIGRKLYVHCYLTEVVEGKATVRQLMLSDSQINILPLVVRRLGPGFGVTEEMLKAAAALPTDKGLEVLKMLLDWAGDDVEITESVVDVVMGNRWSAEAYLKLLMERKGHVVRVSDASLQRLAGDGDEDLLRALRDKARRTIAPEVWRVAALRKATAAGDADAARRLLEEGTDPNVPSRIGETPLRTAVRYRHVELIRLLLEWPGVQIDERTAQIDWSITLPALELQRAQRLEAQRRPDNA
ncbi:Ankyrin repeat-containing domain protein [Cordyceps fumosorosea ARSEF 2679]|uniref:Ankyrin repeat-containing domain protein n=1 Tax=Cordyceps fumosorosea (strain ARSEF 2679) TaxID=1081104 RepID=A0A167NN67_CORFA|nr:Ankyrin repeat-containing domain protein [Cordyceps fumosorosea ARSEF 2679]OAA55743.1 Ankyrin repeat-containing domain protein [Cordyceps fumosorosea ARSEF 2679]